jgi:hypothetical protein
VRRGQSKGQLLDPIVRWEPGGDDGELLLMDTTAMMLHLGVGDRTVRRYEPIACDILTHAPLWDATLVGAARAQIRTRRTRAA